MVQVELDLVRRSLHIVHEVMACKAGRARPYFFEVPERSLMNSYWDSCTVKVFV
jgi:hypothetical protein